ncbi:isoprenyl transferase [Chlamydia muridarum str. Nigg]|mgnify:CR=1 FL=1|jgi:undecaprenyl diphosphate synthase|uniref:Isoprenyl transferase n=2 Tax=Chlamydia muridarum TaxID=83560 RepID=ISPT_CHLMU|nr:isoprenyl transferase [Chlamydia muridarum]Q9PJU2.1 RecName: Full=Isoprenyl transferase [Chlamydia muridarum str. Nigg]AAF39545.1 undecaprenyl pyrophosphate synthetase [Chlamydia muridarum str. Nigg]AHH23121.1 UDP pyrophosphate synthase [Chlamydia muridarum str. Nigg3 CMUT3-5]AHH24046.1 UDP pyrophosphate synthase [Chlamydia muridarum str. Nigg CM972]AID38250.1 UDP pyrophosphate synthase [Chlamydia muridarum str. Nigg 2 MCR]AIT90893.1 UDP pyrophosphate synthase [Chlamydia muridarum]
MSLALEQANPIQENFLREPPLPKHIAIIMDGNRRWQKKHEQFCKSNAISGHRRGADSIPQIVDTAALLGVEALTLFAFSTENFSRSKTEVAELFSLFNSQLHSKLSFLHDREIRLRCIGDLSKLPQELQNNIAKAVSATTHYSHMELIFAINYGSKNELVRAFKELHQDLTNKKISINEISEELISSYLDTSGLPDPDLLIRTGGEMRVSNFLLWQIAYTELYVTDVLWPDFTAHDLLEAIKTYQQRSRRGGK